MASIANLCYRGPFGWEGTLDDTLIIMQCQKMRKDVLAVIDDATPRDEEWYAATYGNPVASEFWRESYSEGDRVEITWTINTEHTYPTDHMQHLIEFTMGLEKKLSADYNVERISESRLITKVGLVVTQKEHQRAPCPMCNETRPSLQTHYQGMCPACYIQHLEGEVARLSAFEEDNCTLREELRLLKKEREEMHAPLSEIKTSLKYLSDLYNRSSK